MKKIAVRIALALLVTLALLLPVDRGRASQGACVMPTTGTVSGLTLVNDINTCVDAIMTNYSGASAPTNGTGGVSLTYQWWLKTSDKTLNVYDAASWLPIGTIDSSGHIWQPPIGGGTATIASASTTNLCSSAASTITISGTTGITSFSNVCVQGITKPIKFSGILAITHNATSMILPNGGSNITTAAGDTALAVYLGGGNWEVWNYQRADGTPLSTTANITGAVFYNGVISPTALAGNTNNWAPTGLSTANTIRFSCSSPFNITGLTAPATTGQIILLDNIGSTNACTLLSESTSSTAGNRFALPFSISMRPLTQLAIRYDLTTARWKLWQDLPAQPVAGSYKNLRVYNVANALGDSAPGTPNNQMTIKADAITVENSAGTAVRLSSVSCTADVSTSGAGGLDTGSVSAPNWYSSWVIYNAITNTTSCLWSASSTLGTITLPSGYTYGVRVGWNYYVTANSVTGLRRVQQYGNIAKYVVNASSNTNVLPTISSGGSTGSISVPTYTSASVSTSVPTTAVRVGVLVESQASGGTVILSTNNAYGGTGSATNPPLIDISAIASNIATKVTLESTSLFVAANNNYRVQITEWDDNL